MSLSSLLKRFSQLLLCLSYHMLELFFLLFPVFLTNLRVLAASQSSPCCVFFFWPISDLDVPSLGQPHITRIQAGTRHPTDHISLPGRPFACLRGASVHLLLDVMVFGQIFLRTQSPVLQHSWLICTSTASRWCATCSLFS